LIRPEDFRWAIVRGFKLRAFASSEYYKRIVGGAACVARPARCDLSRGIVTNDAADTVTFHLVAPDPEFLQRLALMWAFAVPTGTPIEKNIGSFVHLPAPPPATGPYKIASYSPTHEVRLVRNPYFREWSHAARPDGYPDQIVWKIGTSPSAAVTAVEDGRADYDLDAPPPARLGEVRTRFAGQLHPNPNVFTAALLLNTRVAPFNDVRVRRALNYAIDRRRVARLIGQASRPTCQLLPPFIPGYQRYCPYTLNPSRAGIWNAPDLGKARSLIAASHTRGMRVTIWSQPTLGIDYTTTGRYVVSLLDSLGYHSGLTSSSALAPGTPNWSRGGQAAFQTAAPGYPAASEFIQYLFFCPYIKAVGPNSAGSNVSKLCDPRLDATMNSAFAAEAANGPNSPIASELWASADRRVTNDAPLVPLVTPWTLDFVSRRVGNYQYNPQQGVLIDQLWVR
jgi:peptide/nickel transport system substrate-binding protein